MVVLGNVAILTSFRVRSIRCLVGVAEEEMTWAPLLLAKVNCCFAVAAAEQHMDSRQTCSNTGPHPSPGRGDGILRSNKMVSVMLLDTYTRRKLPLANC